VPTYVQYGLPTLAWQARMYSTSMGHRTYQPLDLVIARCRMMVAVRDDFIMTRRYVKVRVCAWQPNMCRPRVSILRQGRACGFDQAVWLDGTGPLVGLSDAIVDLVSSGSTLKATT